jgi:hypothetical protein
MSGKKQTEKPCGWPCNISFTFYCKLVR